MQQRISACLFSFSFFFYKAAKQERLILNHVFKHGLLMLILPSMPWKTSLQKVDEKICDPSLFHGVPWPTLQGWVSCPLVPLSYSTACQTLNSRSAAGICKGQVVSHALQCLNLLPSFTAHWISTSTFVSHHFHLHWSLKPTGGCTLCIFPWRTWEARNCLCTLATSWRKKQSAPPSRQHELNSTA